MLNKAEQVLLFCWPSLLDFSNYTHLLITMQVLLKKDMIH